MKHKQSTWLLAALAGLIVVLVIVSRAIRSGSPEYDANASGRSESAAERNTTNAASSSAAAAVDEAQGRVSHIAAEEAIEPSHALAAAQTELQLHINDSLEGVLYVNAILDRLLEYASLPVSDSVDFDYEDDESAAYKVLGLPDGTVAHFLVGLEPIERDGRRYRQFQFELQMDANRETAFYQDASREGPRVHIALDQDEDGRPAVLAMLTERKVALRDSREFGVNAYEGRFTSGASFRVDLGDPHAYRAETYGIVNGHYALPKDFAAVPLVGDLVIDPHRVHALSQILQQQFLSVRKQNK